MSHPERPVLMIVAAPAGAGKTTLCDRLLAEFPRLRYSISCTTRQPRGNEKDGVDYHFVTEEAFQSRIEHGDFLETANVHGNWYGTLHGTVRDALQAGDDVIMDIDVQGAESIRAAMESGEDLLRDSFFDVFILPPSMQVLEARLIARAEDTSDVIKTRLGNAVGEMECQHKFAHVMTNDDLDQATADLRKIYLSECKTQGGRA